MNRSAGLPAELLDRSLAGADQAVRVGCALADRLDATLDRVGRRWLRIRLGVSAAGDEAERQQQDKGRTKGTNRHRELGR
jgi:hypothetical protein